MDLRLVVPAAAAWISAALLIALPGGLALVALAFWILAVAAVGLAVSTRRGWTVTVALVFAAVAVVASSAAVHSGERRPESLLMAASAGDVVELRVVTTGRITDGPFAATITSVEGAAVPVLVFDGAPRQFAGIGTQLILTGDLEATGPADDVAFLVFASGPSTVVSPAPWLLAGSTQLRMDFAAVATGFPGDGGKLLPGLAIGDTGAVDEPLDAAMKASSLTHLTAVSGANCAIIIGLILLAGGAVRLSRLMRVVASLVVLGGFVVLVTPEPSVLRASVMATIVLLAFAAGRPIRGLPVLGFAVLVLLVLDPWLSRNYGFALSVLATGGLLLLAGPLARLLARWMPLWLGAMIAVPVAAQLACQPVLLLLQPGIPVFGILANVLAAPAAPVATIAGLAACLLNVVAPPLAWMLTAFAWLPAAWISAVAHFFGGLPIGSLPWPEGLVGVATLTVVTVLVLVAALFPLPPQGRRRILFVVAGILVVVVATVAGTKIAAHLGRPSDWHIAACDIGQGDAMVVRSGEKIALMDTGPDPELLRTCLDTLGIGRIDLLVLSHFDLDHVGGSDAILGRVDRVLAGPAAEPADEVLLEKLAEGGAIVERVSRGPTGMLGELRWSVLWPPARLGSIEPGNDASVVVRFDPGPLCQSVCLSSLFLGDVGQQSQDRLISTNGGLDHVDVVEVSHHGSADQSPRLYAAASAGVGLIGVGLDNGYGHPTAEILDILRDTGTLVGRTDTQGLLLVAPGEQPGTLTLWREHNGVVGAD